ncbi:MAG: hypothetical protein JJE28_02225 [Actinomycetales bacterium]|nr:hypothetical protein [Actinomycetales bacterium]
MSGWDKWFTLSFQSILVRGNGVVAIVNTGPAEDLEPMNAGWASFLGERAKFSRGEGEFILDQLSQHGVSPLDVTHVFLTPLQLYSVSNVLAFPNARILISRKGWEHFHTTHEHPHDDRDTSIPPAILTEFMGDVWPRIVLLEDEETVVPGIRTWWTGSHHRASYAVEIDTPKGVVVTTDAFFYLENVELNHPIGICENIYEAMTAHARAKRADIILPLYDPKNFERFPGGIVA